MMIPLIIQLNEINYIVVSVGIAVQVEGSNNKYIHVCMYIREDMYIIVKTHER